MIETEMVGKWGMKTNNNNNNVLEGGFLWEEAIEIIIEDDFILVSAVWYWF